MKRTDLAKNLGLKIQEKQKKAPTPGRFSGDELPDRREQRKLDQARGLVPFATKLPSTLIARLHEEAGQRNVALNDLVAELLESALDK